ncbi:MAG: hypothetical protein ACI9NQ_000690 [Paracoccaceae bacterium]|jgi:hypothetical protein
MVRGSICNFVLLKVPEGEMSVCAPLGLKFVAGLLIEFLPKELFFIAACSFVCFSGYL